MSESKKTKNLMVKLNEFNNNFYFYINQLLGDQTLRIVIQEEFRSKYGWELAFEEVNDDELYGEIKNDDEFQGYHHFCLKGDINPHIMGVKAVRKELKRIGEPVSGKLSELRERLQNALVQNGEIETWCSIDAGIQRIETYPNDTLCQSYSMMNYLNLITDKDKSLTKGLQERMVTMWKRILKNKAVQEQIIFSVESENSIMEVDDEFRNENIIGKIYEVLDEWKEYGYKYYLLHE